MLQVPRLDGDDYASLFERARAKIPTLTSEWTNFNAADPGITTLQTFAWLFDTLHYYMNAAGEVHKLKYLKLLGIRPEQHPAACVLAVEGEGPLDLPAGVQVLAGDVPFETCEPLQGQANRLVSAWLQDGDTLRDITAQAGVDGGFAPLFAPNGRNGGCLYLGFAAPLAPDARLYLELAPQPRTPFAGDFCLAELAWEFYDGQAWRAACVQQDETCGLLRSGFVCLALDRTHAAGTPEALPTACYLRCRVLRNDFDAAPRLGRVLPCCVRAQQVRTWTRVWQGTADGAPALEPDFCVRPGDFVTVCVRRPGEETYIRCGDSADGTVRLPEGPGRVQITFAADACPQRGDELLVLTLTPAGAAAARLGYTDGCSGQRLDIDAENLSSLRLALVRQRDGRTEYQLWERCDDLLEAGWDDCVFRLDEAERQVVFGDSLHGRQPEPGWEVWAVQMQTSRFADGNAMAGRVCDLQDHLAGVTRVFNPAAATGGCRRKTADQLLSQLDEMMRTATRAVTEEDYRAIALATPGLMLDSVAVIPMRRYCDTYPVPFTPNTVIVAVKPRTGGRTPRLSEAYRRAVAAHLEQARLLATEIRVVGARYVGVSVYGRIRLRPGVENARAQVEQTLRDQVDAVDSGAFGRTVDYGRLFSALELTLAVQQVEQLSMEYVGQGGGKNEHGDITTGPDSLSYLREIGIEYI